MTAQALATCVPVSSQVLEAQSLISNALRQIRAVQDADELSEARLRIALAREWAKVQGIAKQMRIDLIRLEIACFKKAVALSALGVLTQAQRSAARYFAEMPDERVDWYIGQYEKATTADGIYKAIRRSEEQDLRNRSGRDFGDGNYFIDWSDDDDETELYQSLEREAAKTYRTTGNAALARVLDTAVSRELSTSISEIADDFIAQLPDNEASVLESDPAFRRGVAEVCRDAVRRSPSPVVRHEYLEHLDIPAFVTAFDGKGYRRIPFQNASLAHLQSMLALRDEQLQQDARAFGRLQRLVSELSAQAESPKDKLSTLVSRADKAAQEVAS